MISARKRLYATDPVTLGEHLKKRRFELGLLQKQASEYLGAGDWTLINWEKNRTTPPIRFWPKIIDFLGYDPYRPPRSSGERIKAIRRNLGLSVKRLASLINVDESTVTRWERNLSEPCSDHWKRIAELIDNFCS